MTEMVQVFFGDILEMKKQNLINDRFWNIKKTHALSTKKIIKIYLRGLYVEWLGFIVRNGGERISYKVLCKEMRKSNIQVNKVIRFENQILKGIILNYENIPDVLKELFNV